MLTISGSATNSLVALQQGGNQVLHAGNFSSYAFGWRGQVPTNGWDNATTGMWVSYDQTNQTGGPGGYGYGGLLSFRASDYDNNHRAQMYLAHTGEFRYRTGWNDWGYGWYTVLNNSNYNSYSPTLTGTGASGTWGISITGNAATATTATTAGSAGSSNAVNNTGYGDGNFTWYQSSGTFAGQSGWASYLISNHGNGDTYYSQTLIMPFWGAPQYSRKQGSSTVVGPYTFLTTENYTSYSPTLTGTGASGTWNISITGNAANGGVTSFNSRTGAVTLTSADVATYAPTLTGTGASGTWGINVTGSAGSVPWSGVTSRPSNIMYYQGFTLDANTMDSNATGFTYSNNAPYTGPVARFSTGGGYDLWLNSPYSGGGNGLAFRTRNGDISTLNPWRQVLHDNNYNSYLSLIHI